MELAFKIISTSLLTSAIYLGIVLTIMSFTSSSRKEQVFLIIGLIAIIISVSSLLILGIIEIYLGIWA